MLWFIENAIKIFKGDLKILKDNPIALIVILAIILIPSLYTLLNVTAAWDPYGGMSNLKVAVVNLDDGDTFHGKHYNVGSLLVDELHNNTNFNWQFVDYEEASSGVKSGKYYASIVIPSNFTDDILSIGEGDIRQGTLEVTINDKINTVAPKIIGTGTTILQYELNSEITSVIDTVIFGKLKDIGNIVAANKQEILGAKRFVIDLDNNMDTISAKIKEAYLVVGSANNVWNKLKDNLGTIKKESNTIRADYDTFEYMVLTNQSGYLNKTNQIINYTTDAVLVLGVLNNSLHLLNATVTDPVLKAKIAEQIELVEEALNLSKTALVYLYEIRDGLSSGELQAALIKYKVVVDKTDDLINRIYLNQDKISSSLSEGYGDISKVYNALPLINRYVDKIAGYVSGLSEDDLDLIVTLAGYDTKSVANYFRTPVSLDSEHVYPVDNYGSALTPFYLSISLWVGALVALSLMNVGLPPERNVSNPAQARPRRIRSRIYNMLGKGSEKARVDGYQSIDIYFGRMGLFLLIALLQGFVVSVGCLLIGVVPMRPVLFVLLVCLVAVSIMLIVYSLVSVFGDVGKAIAVILLVFQVAASGGTFPAEALPQFFSMLSHWLPLTYSVAAIREVIFGVYWPNLIRDVCVFLVYPLVALFLASLIKERFNAIVVWFKDKLGRTKLFE